MLVCAEKVTLWWSSCNNFCSKRAPANSHQQFDFVAISIHLSNEYSNEFSTVNSLLWALFVFIMVLQLLFSHLLRMLRDMVMLALTANVLKCVLPMAQTKPVHWVIHQMLTWWLKKSKRSFLHNDYDLPHSILFKFRVKILPITCKCDWLYLLLKGYTS